jgi:8-oxo-dGTP pyrophosphatase MutT (NUDIX family)
MMSPAFREHRLTDDSFSAPKASGVLILLYPVKNEWYIPFIQRPVYEGFHSGQISFPGGKAEESDKSLLHTALRETHEEIGISPPEVNIMGQLTPLYLPKSNFNVYPFAGWLESTPRFVPDPLEVAEIIEVSLNELLNPSCIKNFSYQAGDFTITAPYYDAGGKKIWGATAMILSEMIEIIRKL